MNVKWEAKSCAVSGGGPDEKNIKGQTSLNLHAAALARCQRETILGNEELKVAQQRLKGRVAIVTLPLL